MCKVHNDKALPDFVIHDSGCALGKGPKLLLPKRYYY
jgi:hypothetical protein